MLDRLIEIINFKTGRRFWYEIRLIYYIGPIISDTNCITKVCQCGAANKKSILQRREIKKFYGNWVKRLPKEHLQNGSFQIHVVCYLGWFKRQLAGDKENAERT